MEIPVVRISGKPVTPEDLEGLAWAFLGVGQSIRRARTQVAQAKLNPASDKERKEAEESIERIRRAIRVLNDEIRRTR